MVDDTVLLYSRRDGVGPLEGFSGECGLTSGSKESGGSAKLDGHKGVAGDKVLKNTGVIRRSESGADKRCVTAKRVPSSVQ